MKNSLIMYILGIFNILNLNFIKLLLLRKKFGYFFSFRVNDLIYLLILNFFKLSLIEYFVLIFYICW